MQLDSQQTQLLLNKIRPKNEEEQWRYQEIFKTISNELRKYEGKQLLVITHKSEIDGTKTPLLMFAEYAGLDPSSPFIDDLRFYFKKPLLYTDIKIRKKKLESSSIRFRWHKMGNYYSKFFLHAGHNKITISTTRNYGMIHKEDLVFDLNFSANSFPYNSSSNRTIRDFVFDIFSKKADLSSHSNLYGIFERKYMTDCSYD